MATRWVKIKDLVRKPSIERRIHNWYHDTMKRVWRKIEDFSRKLSSISWGKALQHEVEHIMTDEDRRKRREAFEHLKAMISGEYTADKAELKREQTK